MATSSRTTGNEPIENIDPGGSRPGPHAKNKAKTEQKVVSGDRNSGQSSEVAPSNTPEPRDP